MSPPERQPSHQTLSREIAALGASVNAKLDGIEKQVAIEFKHIKERMDAGDLQRGKMVDQLTDIGTRTAVLESHEGAAKPKEPEAAALPRMPRWAMAAAIVALIGGLKSSAVAIEQIAVALWNAIKGGGI
jgi:hypothetical protein